MTREALADRLVNYADAVTAFAAVNALAFLVGLTEPEIRCSLAHLDAVVHLGQIAFGLIVTGAVVALRRLELRVRASCEPLTSDVLQLLRGFFLARIVVIWLTVVITAALASVPLDDTTCFTQAA